MCCKMSCKAHWKAKHHGRFLTTFGASSMHAVHRRSHYTINFDGVKLGSANLAVLTANNLFPASNAKDMFDKKLRELRALAPAHCAPRLAPTYEGSAGKNTLPKSTSASSCSLKDAHLKGQVNRLLGQRADKHRLMPQSATRNKHAVDHSCKPAMHTSSKKLQHQNHSSHTPPIDGKASEPELAVANKTAEIAYRNKHLYDQAYHLWLLETNAAHRVNDVARAATSELYSDGLEHQAYDHPIQRSYGQAKDIAKKHTPDDEQHNYTWGELSTALLIILLLMQLQAMADSASFMKKVNHTRYIDYNKYLQKRRQNDLNQDVHRGGVRKQVKIE